MLKQKKRPTGGKPGGRGRDEEGLRINYPHYTPKRRKTQYVSGMLDLALSRIEFHRGEADRLRRLADWHMTKVAEHQAIKKSLEKHFIPRGLS